MAGNDKRNSIQFTGIKYHCKKVYGMCQLPKIEKKWGLDMSFAIPLSLSGPETLGQSYKTFYSRNLQFL